MLPSLILSIFTFLNFGEETTDLLGVKGPIKFHNTDFVLSLSGQPDNNMLLHVYLPKGEDLEIYNQRISLLVIHTEDNINKVVKKKLNELTQRQKQDYNCKFEAKELKEDSEFLIESVVSESNNGAISEAEYTVTRVKAFTTTESKGAILIYSYSWRTYEDEAKQMLNNLAELKKVYLQAMMTSEIPKVKFALP